MGADDDVLKLTPFFATGVHRPELFRVDRAQVGPTLDNAVERRET